MLPFIYIGPLKFGTYGDCTAAVNECNRLVTWTNFGIFYLLKKICLLLRMIQRRTQPTITSPAARSFN
jgi:hypothetical protein